MWDLVFYGVRLLVLGVDIWFWVLPFLRVTILVWFYWGRLVWWGIEIVLFFIFCTCWCWRAWFLFCFSFLWVRLRTNYRVRWVVAWWTSFLVRFSVYFLWVLLVWFIRLVFGCVRLCFYRFWIVLYRWSWGNLWIRRPWIICFVGCFGRGGFFVVCFRRVGLDRSLIVIGRCSRHRCWFRWVRFWIGRWGLDFLLVVLGRWWWLIIRCDRRRTRRLRGSGFDFRRPIVVVGWGCGVWVWRRGYSCILFFENSHVPLSLEIIR